MKKQTTENPHQEYINRRNDEILNLKHDYVFYLTPEQVKKFEGWRKKLPKTEGSRTYSFTFTNTGIGTHVEVGRSDDDKTKKLDLTEYEHW